MIIEDHMKIKDPLTEEDILMEVGDPLEEKDTLVEDPLIEEEDPLMEEDPLDLLEDKDHHPSRTPWTSQMYNSPNPSSDIGYNCFGKHFQYCWAVYVTIG